MANIASRVYLTGFMGSGKSTIGSILANVLGYGFIDLDEAIAAEAGKPVSAIFAEEGEAAFRAQEAAALRATAARDGVVVALGGGALTIEANLRWALSHGVVVYLRVSPEALLRRLRRGRSVRPLLLDDAGDLLPPEALRERIDAMMARREPFYQRAHLTVEIDKQRVGKTVDAVARALRGFRG